MDKIKKVTGRFLSLILAAAMCVSLVPVSNVTALAADKYTVTLADCGNGGETAVPVGEEDDGFAFSMPGHDVTVYAEFCPVTDADVEYLPSGGGEEYTVSLDAAEGVAVTLVDENGDPADMTGYEEGDTVYVNATAEEGYELTDGITLSINDAVIDADARIGDLTVAFDMPDDDVEVTAEAETEVVDGEEQEYGLLRLLAATTVKRYDLSGDWEVLLYMSGNSW